MSDSRLAVFWVPPAGSLLDALSSWLGWDPVAAERRTPPALPGLPGPADAITERPRRYGPHATLRPPMRLAPGRGEQGLREALAALAAGRGPARAEGLRVAPMGAFLALRPEGDGAALAELAAEVVRATDPLRAEPAGEELARRRAAGLTDRQEAMLRRWGYPYVMDEFRFHVTLSGPLAPDEAGALGDALGPRLGPHLPRPFELGSVSLLREGEDGLFREVERFALGG